MDIAQRVKNWIAEHLNELGDLTERCNTEDTRIGYQMATDLYFKEWHTPEF